KLMPIECFMHILTGSRVIHLISSAVLHFGGIYHAFLGPKTFEESFPFIGYVWKDRNKMTTILCIHLIFTERLFILEVKITNLALNPGVIFGYLLKFPFGGEAWITRTS
ncbi:hypothetical protein ACJX0J_033234, partial [Zea mays]